MTAIKKIIPVLKEELPPPGISCTVIWLNLHPFCNTICLIQMSNKGSKYSNVTCTAFSSHSFRVQTWQFGGKCILQRWFLLQFWQQCLNKTSALRTELQYDSLADSFCFGICNTQWEVLLSTQVNYNQVVVKCYILQECFLQNFNMQKFQNMEHSNSRTFQGLSRTSQGPYELWCYMCSCYARDYSVKCVYLKQSKKWIIRGVVEIWLFKISPRWQRLPSRICLNRK